MQEEEKKIHGDEEEEEEKEEEEAASSSDDAMSESSEESSSASDSSNDGDAVMALHGNAPTLRVQLKVQLAPPSCPGHASNSLDFSYRHLALAVRHYLTAMGMDREQVGEDERVQLVVKRDAYDPEELRAEIDRMEREGPDAGVEEEDEVEAAQR